jgi:Ca2+-binding EF-hand superfamily protein
MKGYDTKGTGRIDKPAFKKCLKQLSVAMSDTEILKVATEIAPIQNDVIDVKQFCNSVAEAGKVKPLPNYIS